MFPSDSTRVTVFWNIGPLRHIAFLPSLGHRNDHPCLSCKIGPINFSSLTSFSAFWNIPVGLFGLFAYLFGLRRIVYCYEEGSHWKQTADMSEPAPID